MPLVATFRVLAPIELTYINSSSILTTDAANIPVVSLTGITVADVLTSEVSTISDGIGNFCENSSMSFNASFALSLNTPFDNSVLVIK